MNTKLELYGELELLIREDDVELLAKGMEGNVYPVEAATVEDLEKLNSLPLKDVSSVADVKEMLNEIGLILGQKCTNGEYLDVEDYNIIYNHQEKRFISVSDLEMHPVYIYYDGNDWISVWLPEPDFIIEIDDEEIIELDKWDGSDYMYGKKGCHAEAYQVFKINGKPVEDKYLIHYWSSYIGDEPTGEIISEKELEDIVTEMKGETK